MTGTLRIGVIGGGAFGQGICRAAARKEHHIILSTRRSEVDIEGVTVTHDLAPITDTELIFIATPSQYVPPIARELGGLTDGSHLMVHVSRGLVGHDLKPITSILRELTPCRRLGVLAGPLLAQDLWEGRPSGAIVGTHFPEVTEAVRTALGGPSLRIYSTDDVVGVQVASAVVGMLAVVLGYAQEAGASPAALAVLATRGIDEFARVGETMGAKKSTFMGLAGFGDLIAAVSGDTRPESLLGQQLAKGLKLERAIAYTGSNVEGIETARCLLEHADRVGQDVPISRAFVQLLDGKLSREEAAEALMARRVGKG